MFGARSIQSTQLISKNQTAMETSKKFNWEEMVKALHNRRRSLSKRVFEIMLPSPAILFLYKIAASIRIEMMVEKREKDDYVLIEAEGDNKRLYLLELLFAELKTKYTSKVLVSDMYERRDRKSVV